MKHVSYYLIMLVAFILPACDQQDAATSTFQAVTQQEILNRSADDCIPCPAEHCCCAIEYLDFNEVTFHFCGVYNPVIGSPCGTFNPGSPCNSISGTTKVITIGPFNTREIFCVPVGESFRIYNYSGGKIKFRLTCQFELIDPDSGIYELDNGESLYFASNGECYLVGC